MKDKPMAYPRAHSMVYCFTYGIRLLKTYPMQEIYANRFMMLLANNNPDKIYGRF